MIRSKLVPIAMAFFMATGAAGAALADSEDNDLSSQEEIAAVTSAKTSLVQAIATAEQQTGGKAVSTDLSNQNGAVAYEVETISGNTLQTVLVDLNTGQVLKVVAGEAEDDGDND